MSFLRTSIPLAWAKEEKTIYVGVRAAVRYAAMCCAAGVAACRCMLSHNFVLMLVKVLCCTYIVAVGSSSPSIFFLAHPPPHSKMFIRNYVHIHTYV